MSILIVCAPDEGARAFGRELGAQANCRYYPMEEADEAVICGADAIVLVLPDYYTHACWQMKSWLSGCIDLLSGKLCSCVTICSHGGGGELAMRTIVSQLLGGQCPVYLCGVLCSDGRIRPGGCAELRGEGLSPEEYIGKLSLAIPAALKK